MWIAAFDEGRVKKVLEIPEDVCVVAMAPLGYAAENKEPVVERKPMEEISFILRASKLEEPFFCQLTLMHAILLIHSCFL